MISTSNRFRSARHFPRTLLATLRDRRLPKDSHRLAICAIFKDEGRYLGEWIAFHRKVGVEHFYLYDNGSSDNFAEVLSEPIRSGFVTYTRWPDYPGQMSAYQHCVKHHASDARWIAFIDIDEFLWSPRGENLPTVLERYSDCPAVFVHSYHFGSSGHRERPAVPMLQAYTLRESIPTCGKTIANPRWIREITNPHLFRYWGMGNRTLNTERQAAEPLGQRRPTDVLRINHYWSRSLVDLEAKIARTDPLARPVSAEGYRKRESQYNEVEDVTIRSIAP